MSPPCTPLSLSPSLLLQGYWWLNLSHPWSFFRFTMTSSSLYFFFFFFRSTQIGIFKRTHKGHLFSIPSCVALHYLRCVTFFPVCLISYCNVLNCSLWYLIRVLNGPEVCHGAQKNSDVWHFQREELCPYRVLGVKPDAPLLLSPLPLWYWLHSFSDIIKSHNPWLLVHRTFSEKACDVSIWLYRSRARAPSHQAHYSVNL